MTFGDLPVLPVILGPTGSGKTALALALAERVGGEIVSCDSVAVYREFEIGTAKPSPADRTRVPHHLLDVVSPQDRFTAGDYARLARAAIAETAARGRVPILAGGTGLYLRALIDGLFVGPKRSEEARDRLRARAARLGTASLHRILTKLDRETARRIHPNDEPKLVRALEVRLVSGRPISNLWKEGREPLGGFRVIRIGLDPNRECLYSRIDRRAREMFDRGLIDETHHILGRHGDSPWALGSLGYKQAVQCLRGAIPREEAVARAQQGHRNYAKRQLTWFRREPDTLWYQGFGEDPEIQQQVMKICNFAI